jgi:hypothetical protein
MHRSKRDEQTTVTAIYQKPTELELENQPQAIFARAIKFFTMTISTDVDELDEFSYAAFSINNRFHFSLRHYRNDPAKATSLYSEPLGAEEAREMVILACKCFGVTPSVLHWMRGQPFRHGQLEPIKHVIKEREARDIVLKVAATFKNRTAKTSDIKNRVEELVALSDLDKLPYPSRGKEPRWRQQIGNVVSHANTSTSIFSRKLAVKTAKDEIRVTKVGLDYLKSIGFSVADFDL